MIQPRYVVAAVILLFAWKDSNLSITWPPAHLQSAVAPKPPAEALKLAESLRPLLPKMLPADRAYLSSFYDAVSFVLLQDGQRSQPIITNTEKFAAFHANSLKLAIQKGNVGKYPGLDDAIDQAFFAAAGPEVKDIDADTRSRLIVASSVLSYVLRINGDG